MAKLEPVIQELFVSLTPDEQIIRGQQLAMEEDAYTKTELLRKSAMNDYKKQMDANRLRIGELTTVVQGAREIRKVECVWHPNVDRHTMELFRIDTGELVNSRPMTDAERQMDIFNSEEVECSQCESLPFANLKAYMEHRLEAHPLDPNATSPAPTESDPVSQETPDEDENEES